MCTDNTRKPELNEFHVLWFDAEKIFVIERNKKLAHGERHVEIVMSCDSYWKVFQYLTKQTGHIPSDLKIINCPDFQEYLFNGYYEEILGEAEIDLIYKAIVNGMLEQMES